MATPNEILEGQGCFACLPPEQLAIIRTVLLYQISGSVATPNEILEDAGCFACLPPAILEIIQAVLLDTIASNPAGGAITGSGSPEGVVTASVGQIYFDISDPNNPILYVKTTGAGNTGWV